MFADVDPIGNPKFLLKNSFNSNDVIFFYKFNKIVKLSNRM